MIKRVLSTSFHSIISRFFITATNLFLVFFISKNLGKVQLGTYGIVFFFFMFFALIFSVSLLLSRNLIVAAFSPEFLHDTGKYLFYFSFILIFRFFSFSTGIILTSADAQKTRFNIMFTASIIMIALDIILGSQLQVTGMIISRAVTEIFIFFIFGYYVNRIISRYDVIRHT